MPEDPQDLPTEAQVPEPPAPSPAAVVGLGGSAGALESYEQFLTSLPDGGDLALVVVAHLDPDAGRGLVGLLARCTALPVEEVTDGLSLRPGRVYVAPAGQRVSLLNGTLLLGNGDGHLSIDSFFESLAADQGPRAVGVVFSGAGQDGRRGLGAIKAAGGLAFVQDPAGAGHGGMPRAAAETGVADAVLPPEDLAAELHARVTHSPGLRLEGALTATGQLSPALQKVLLHVRARTGQDFSGYKHSTLVRRIDRRMGTHGITDLATYARYLAEHPAETDALFRDLLINVTSFFRDPLAFVALGAQVRAYLEAHPDLTSFRVWVPGCSTGEEAYSVAILLSEVRESLGPGRPLHVQVFATDLDQEAIETARLGFYPGQIEEAVGPERLERYFVARDGGYQVVPQVREMVVFARHNTFSDPPFTRLDLLSCRNLLIYLGPELQAQVLPLFHYALKPGGLLLLGPSESLGAARGLFTPLDARWKLFVRQGQSSTITLPLGSPVGVPLLPRSALPPGGERPVPETPNSRAGVARAVQHLLLSEWTPPTVTVDAQGNVVYVSGSTRAYLELPSGSPSTDILELARPALRYELSAALRQAADTGQEVRHTGIGLPGEGDGGSRVLDLTVRPLRLPQHAGLLYVIVLQEREREAASGGPGGADPGGRVTELERELRYTKEYLQTAVEEMEVSLEERKSTNEELQTANEELQSSNEELMSSKEELQSLNEELVTINAEHQVIISDLQQANDDIKNLLDSIGVATLFLDNDLRIKRFTPKITAVANLIASDMGRPIGDITFNLRHEGLQDDLARVLQSLMPFETQVQTKGGAWFLMRISPYRTFDNFIDGVVVVFLSVDHLKRLETQVRTSRLYADAVLDTMHDPVVVLDGHLRVVTANPALLRLLGVEPAEVQGERLYDLGLGQFDQPEFTRALRDVVLGHAAMSDFLLDFETPSAGRRVLKTNAEQLVDEGAETDLVLLWMEDVTDLLRQAAEAGAEAERGGGEEA